GPGHRERFDVRRVDDPRRRLHPGPDAEVLAAPRAVHGQVRAAGDVRLLGFEPGWTGQRPVPSARPAVLALHRTPAEIPDARGGDGSAPPATAGRAVALPAPGIAGRMFPATR